MCGSNSSVGNNYICGQDKLARMAKLKILVWKSREGTGTPDAEVTIPAHLSKWASRMMRFMPKNVKEDWGKEIDLKDFDLDELIKEAMEKGESEILDVRAKNARVKIVVEK